MIKRNIKKVIIVIFTLGICLSVSLNPLITARANIIFIDGFTYSLRGTYAKGPVFNDKEKQFLFTYNNKTIGPITVVKTKFGTWRINANGTMLIPY